MKRPLAGVSGNEGGCRSNICATEDLTEPPQKAACISSNDVKCAAPKGGKQINPGRFNDSYALQFPNALPAKTIIWAKESVSACWMPCTIIHARPNTVRHSSSASYSSAAPRPVSLNDVLTGARQLESAPGSLTKALGNAVFDSHEAEISYTTEVNAIAQTNSDCGNGFANIFNAESSSKHSDYEYYVHYIGLDRRLDSWQSWENLRETEDMLPKGEPIVRELEPDEEDEHAGMDEEYLREHEESTKLKTVERICMGSYLVDCWYFSPYPSECQRVETLYICEFCLAFFVQECELQRHSRHCDCRHPPGNEIYRDERVAMFEVDGLECRVYCENLCFLSKLFLDHKTLRHPVNLFLFYVMTEYDSKGHHITGYFSKEKHSKNNLSCLLTLPQHQRKGYGKFLISFSYSLSMRERRTGTPERPLSDLGRASYIAYWTEQLLSVLQPPKMHVSLQELSEATCIEMQDILTCLERQGILRSKGDSFFLLLPPQKMEALRRSFGRPSRPVLPERLHWVPYDKYMAPAEAALPQP